MTPNDDPVRRWRRAATLLLACMVGSCGGGSSPDSGDRQRPRPVVSALNVFPAYAWVNKQIGFQASCAGLAPISFHWTFGDGSESRNAQATAFHSYKESGVFNAQVRCEDANGVSPPQSQRIYVHPRDLTSVADANCVSSYPGFGWCRQQPLISGPMFRQVVAMDADTLWGVSRSGTVLRTYNNGGSANWLENVRELAVASPSVAWVAARDTILYTSQGDINYWDIWKAPQTPPSRPADALQAVSESAAWALGGLASSVGPAVMRSTDRGVTWSDTAWRPGARTVRALFARDANTAWVVGDGGLIERTDDGGTTWQTVSPLPNEAVTADLVVVGVNAQRSAAWVASREGTLLALDLDSQRWTVVRPPVPPSGSTVRITTVSPLDAQTAWVAGESANGAGPLRPFLALVNAGTQLWRSVPVAADEERLLSVSARSDGLAWVAGARTLLRAGPSDTVVVSRLQSPTLQGLTSLSAISDSTAFAVGEGGTVLRTLNGGRDWQLRAPAAGATLTAVLALTENVAWAVANSPDLYKTTDGGATWTKLAGVAPQPLTAFARYANLQVGEGAWVFGRDGTVLIARGDAAQPLAVDCPAARGLDVVTATAFSDRSPWFIGRNAAPPTGTATAILLTLANDNTACREVPLDGAGDLRTVVQPNANDVWVLGVDAADGVTAVVWLSRDGGTQWQRYRLADIQQPHSLAAIDGGTAWVISPATFWRVSTTANGLNVTPQTWLEAGLNPVRSLQAVDATALWGVGDGGQIWKTLTGGEGAETLGQAARPVARRF